MEWYEFGAIFWETRNMKITNNKAPLIPVSRVKKKSVTPKRTAEKISSAKSTTEKKKIATNIKVAPKKIACSTKQAELKSSSIARRTARRVSNIADPRVARISRKSGPVEMGVAIPAASNQVLSPNTLKGSNMNLFREFTSRQGKIGYILAWAVGIPVPLLIIVFLLRGCN